jgi:tRNA threonylcarbamoyladenosine biosynthesis protein TsaB
MTGVSDPSPRFLVLETSCRRGQVALARGEAVLRERCLDESRRHARDLAPAVAELLAEEGWHPRDIEGVIVGRGPGSYTGLRVGVMSAKAFAYATGCALLGVETFAALALQAPEGVDRLDVLADAQQDKVYVQAFARGPAGWAPCAELAVRPFADWLADRPAGAWVTGPGLEKWEARLPAEVPRLERRDWAPQPASLARLGLEALRAGRREGPFGLEPLYLRASSAEEKRQK